MKKHLYTICFSTVLAAFTLFVVLDTFVISRPMEYAQQKINTSMFSSHENAGKTDHPASKSDSSPSQTDTAPSESSPSQTDTDPSDSSPSQTDTDPSDSDPSQTDTESAVASGKAMSTEGGRLIGTYQNDQASIRLYQYEYESTTVYAADIVLSSSEYLRTAFAKDYYGKNVTEKTSTMAEQNHAILAINGDYYGAQENGYVIRNGVVFRDSRTDADLLCVYADGTMRIVNSAEKTAQALVDEGVWQAFCFGPALVQNGQVDVNVSAEVGKAMASNPRTAVGMIAPCHYVFVVSDGRTNESKGLSLYQLATFMQNLGVSTAYNLDGGGSSTLYFNGEIINYPTTSGKSMKERGVSDIVYIAK